MGTANNNGTLSSTCPPAIRRRPGYITINGDGWQLAIPRRMWDGWTPGEQQAAIRRQQAMMAKDGK